MKNKQEEWKKRGYYPDGEKYDDSDDEPEADIATAYANLGREVPFDPVAAKGAAKQFHEKANTEEREGLIPGTNPELKQKLPEGYSNSAVDANGRKADTLNDWAYDERE